VLQRILSNAARMMANRDETAMVLTVMECGVCFLRVVVGGHSYIHWSAVGDYIWQYRVIFNQYKSK